MKLLSHSNHSISAKLALLFLSLLASSEMLRAANPSITGTVNNIQISDVQTTNIFASADVNQGDTNLLTVYVDFAPTSLGTLSPLPSGVSQSGTNYLIGPTNETSATAILRSLTFNPTDNFIPVPNPSNVVFHAYIVDAGTNTSSTRTTTVQITATNDAPSLTTGGPFTHNITDKTNTPVFTNVTIADVDDGGAQPLIVAITLDATNKGTFTSLSGFTSNGSNYTFNGTPAAATTAIHGLVFVPTPNRVTPGQSETTTFTVSVDDSFAAPVTSSAYSVTALSINDAPTLTAGAPLTNSITDQTNTAAFAGVTIADVDNRGTQHVTVTIILDSTNKGDFISLSGFTLSGSNYVFNGTPAAATTAIHSLLFKPTPNHVPVGQSETTDFTILVDDNIAEPVTNTSYSVVALSVNDAPQLSGVTTNHFLVQTGQGTSPFSVVTYLDADQNLVLTNTAGEDLTWQVTLSGPAPLGHLEFNGVAVGTNYGSAGDPSVSTLGLRSLTYHAPTLAISGTNTLTLAVSAADGHGGTVSSNIYIDLYSLVLPPGLSGTQSGQIVNDNTTIAPFSKVNIQSFNGTSVTLLIKLAGGATNDIQGTLLGSFSRTTNASSPSVYQFTGTSENATAAIRGLLFQPTPNRINGSSNELVTFSITLIDGSITNNADTSTTVNVVPVNDVPVIAGVSPLVTIQDNETLPPFPTVLITDADELGLQPIAATITLDVAAKGSFSTNSLILSGFVSNNGSYTFTGSGSNLTAAIRKLVFVPTPNRVPVGLTEITTFNINLNDSRGGIVANNGTSIRVASVSGVPVVNLPSPQPVSIPLGTNIFPFQQVSVTDPTTLKLSLRINDSAQGSFSASSVSASGFTNLGGGFYFITGSASNVTSALGQLDFVPAPALPLGATINFTISVTNTLPNYVTVNHAIILRTVQNSFIVTKLTDYDPAANVPLSQQNGTLRKAISDAKNNDHITFDIRAASAGQPDYPAVIRLVAPLVLNNNLTFDGPGAERLSISGDFDANGTPDTQLFLVNAAVTMNRLAFTKGYASFAGGAFEISEFGDLKLSYCSITDCTADVWGGGVDVDLGSLSMDHCLVAGNRTSSSLGQGGGGISFYTYWPCSVANTTFATNRQDAVGGLGGGAIYAETPDPGVEFDLDILSCTFHDNRDEAGHGTSIRPNVFNTIVRLQNTIVADGQGKNIEMDQSGAVISMGGNISDDATASIFSSGGLATNTFIFHPPADQVSINVSNILNALANNGGPTLTFELTTNSTAIGGVVSNTPAGAFYSLLGTDQRGYFRDHNPDIGSFERGASQRIIIEELRFNPAPPNTNDEFIEFYVPRDSATLNVDGFKVLVDGTLRHTFTNQMLQPGEALVLFSAGTISNGVPSGVYRQIASGNLLMDNAGGVITLLNASNQVLFVADYVGGFTSTDPNDYGFLSANYQSLVLCPQFQGAFLPYQRVVAKEGGSNTNGLANAGYDVLGNPLAVGNVPPLAYDDIAATDAHTIISAINVLNNDTDLDITDAIRVVAVGTNGNVSGMTNYSLLGARLIINDSPSAGASVSYDPTASAFLTSLPQGSNVVDSFQYTILDSSNGVDHVRGVTAPEIALNLAKATATVTVNVVGINSAPLPQLDNVITRTNLTTAEDALLDFTTAVNLLANDLDPNSDDSSNTLNIVSICSTNNYVSNLLSIVTDLGATVTLDLRFDRNETHITYDPRGSAVLNALGLGQTTNDTFYYSVKDSYGVIGTAPVSIQVTGVNDTPIANADSFATDEDTGVALPITALLANDTDPDNGTILNLSAIVTPVSALGASVTVNGTNVVYDPTVSSTLNALANKEFATDTFTYTLNDEHGLSSNAVVTVIVAGVNDRPISQPDTYSTDEDLSTTNNAPGVLVNDVEPDINGILPDDSFRVIPATNLTEHGASVAVADNGSFAFDPRGLFDWLIQGEQTTETFNYIVMDHSLSVANDDVFSVTTSSENNFLPVLANDSVLSQAGGAFHVTSLTAPDHGGVVSINLASNGVTYTPLAGYVGLESFSYTVSDGLGGYDTANVTITLTASTLYANADSFTVAKGTTNSLNLLLNDNVLPPTGASISITSLGIPSLGGAVSVNGVGANNLVNYIPNPAQPTPFVETFSYTATSASLVSTGIVSVTVIDRSNSLTANNDNFTVIANSGNISLDVLGNDLILPGPNTNLIITAFTTNSVLGAVSLNAAHNRLVYKPSSTVSNQFEPVITYTISDNAGGTATASVTIQVVPEGFIANSDTFVVEKNSTNNLPVMINDVILPNLGQTLFISGIGIGTNAPNHGGSVSIDGPGTGLVYTPSSNYTGGEDFTYEISDGSPSRALGHVHVVVLDNSPATSNPDTFRIARDSANNLLLVLSNDYTLPKTPSAFTIIGLQTNGVHSTITISAATANNALLYSPNSGFIGRDTFSYEFVDTLGNHGTNQVSVTVGELYPRNDLFAALSDSSANLLDVLANDFIYPDASGLRTVFALGTPDSGGAVNLNVGATGILYTPASGFHGVEHFTYQLKDDSTNLFAATATVFVKQRGSDRDTNTVTVTVIGVNDLPTVTGTSSGIAITDKQTTTPFSQLTIGDLDEYGLQHLTTTISFDETHGILTNLSGFYRISSGVYRFSGTGAQVSAAARALIFIPFENRIPVPTSELTQFTISVNDGFVATPVVNNSTTVIVSAANDAPTIAGTIAALRVYQYSSIMPFVGVTIRDIDNQALQPVRVTVTLNDPSHGFLSTLGGFTSLGGGVYQMGSTNGTNSASRITSDLRRLLFVPTTGTRVTPGFPETTQFTITVEDGVAVPVVNSATTVTATHEFISKILANDGAASDQFGQSVAATREVIVVGSPFDDDKGVNSGGVYVYLRQPTNVLQVQKIVPTDGAAANEFGNSVAASGDTIVVGARFATGTRSSGAVYIYQRNVGSSNTWSLSAKVFPSDPENGDQFGYSVAISGDTIAVGSRFDDDRGSSSGSVYLFSRNQGGTNSWGQIKKLVPADGVADDQFGSSVGISGDNVVGGALGNTQNGIKSGAAYLFSRNQGGTNNWGLTKKLIPSDGVAGDEFGAAVAIDGDNAAVGARSHSALGVAYVFSRASGGNNNWGQIKELVSPSPNNGDQFGYSISINQDKLIVGSPFAGLSNQSRFGTAYLFVQDQGGLSNWGLVQEMKRSDSENNDEFGFGVAVSENTLVVGTPLDDDKGADSGSAYVYRLKFNNAPVLVTALTNQTAVVGVPFNFPLPTNTFGDPDVRDVLTLSAFSTNSDPAWLSFSSVPGGFSGLPNGIGQYTIFVAAKDEGSLSVSNSFSLLVKDQFTASLEAWRTRYFGATSVGDPSQEAGVWGDSADPDGDGRSNYLEYLDGTNPVNASGNALRVTGQPGNLVKVSYNRRTLFNYTLENSIDLVTWSSSGVTVQSQSATPIEDDLELVEVTISPQPETQQFFRIKIQ